MEYKWVCKESKQKTARYLIGKQGWNPLVLFTLFAEDQSLSHWDNRIKNVVKMSQSLDCDGWLIINVYPVKIKNIKELDVAGNKELIFRNRVEIKKLFNDFEIPYVWAAWGDEINANEFLIHELNILASRIPQKVKWITVGKLSEKGNPFYNENPKTIAMVKPFDFKDYIKKHS